MSKPVRSYHHARKGVMALTKEELRKAQVELRKYELVLVYQPISCEEEWEAVRCNIHNGYVSFHKSVLIPRYELSNELKMYLESNMTMH